MNAGDVGSFAFLYFIMFLVWDSNLQQWGELRSRSTKKKTMMIPSVVSLVIFIIYSVLVGFFFPILCMIVFLWFVLGLFCFLHCLGFFSFLPLPCPADER